jgi:hypothetical protein
MIDFRYQLQQIRCDRGLSTDATSDDGFDFWSVRAQLNVTSFEPHIVTVITDNDDDNEEEVNEKRYLFPPFPDTEIGICDFDAFDFDPSCPSDIRLAVQQIREQNAEHDYAADDDDDDDDDDEAEERAPQPTSLQSRMSGTGQLSTITASLTGAVHAPDVVWDPSLERYAVLVLDVWLSVACSHQLMVKDLRLQTELAARRNRDLSNRFSGADSAKVIELIRTRKTSANKLTSDRIILRDLDQLQRVIIPVYCIAICTTICCHLAEMLV